MILQENLRRATAELVILHLLLEEDLYGYQIVQKIKNMSGGKYTLPEGTLYPVMYRLSSKGLVCEFTRMIKKRMRRYYHIEDEGLAYYEEMLAGYKEIMQGVDNILNLEGGGADGEPKTITSS